ncbi:hypothetical protein SYNPS1DRAFT_27517 [Syncephalis pseudoplumigaleata]|uniref:C3H1-type domain-containing protein n=1 Tax=Syncephalis pseudoplumigaleata TaxID=1712513 RepID=A0A4P9Z2P6_9FUNG|nr:hypothetical protein SYNPS1DRAFT_27517 [Syncephalis pseudoplumigaleata]|eukprot:RKP26807.1 hypothetical protein SYNPS1DRAFT_27517 [Syncephalis pseudoplumigaleata]
MAADSEPESLSLNDLLRDTQAMRISGHDDASSNVTESDMDEYAHLVDDAVSFLDERDGSPSAVPPFPARGHCRYGNDCRFRHVAASSADKANGHRRSNNAGTGAYKLPIPCRNWTSSGSCPWGDQCRYQHVTADAGSAHSHPPTASKENKEAETNGAKAQPGDVLSADNSELLSENDTLLSTSDDGDGDPAETTETSDSPHQQQQQQPAMPAPQRPRANTSDAGTSRATCRYWASSGRCRWMDRCRFQHDVETRGANQQQQQQQQQQQDPSSSAGDSASDVDPYTAHFVNQLKMEAMLLKTMGRGDYDPSLEDSDETGMCGFSADEVMELLAQGVKPWEEDARMVMDALTMYPDDDDDDYYYDDDDAYAYYGYGVEVDDDDADHPWY